MTKGLLCFPHILGDLGKDFNFNSLLEIMGFATKIQLHVTHATTNLCSCVRQVAHDM
jgi:hypothetical protein